MKGTLAALPAILLVACRGGGDFPEPRAWTPEQFAAAGWNEVAQSARSTSVSFGMWAGDEERNRYFRGPVAEALRRKFGITLRIVGVADAAELINKLLNEKRAGKTSGGSIDMIWINGENFRTARQGGVLWGPFAESLPNIRYYTEEARARDFGTPVEGYEAPWQRAQFVMAYDTARVPDPPRSMEKLGAWIKNHPGRFTYLAPPDFTGSAFLRHVLFHFGGNARAFQDGFDAELYKRASEATFAWLNEIKPYLWRKGETYPMTPREQDRLFANGEIDFAMSYGPSFASVRMERGEYPPTTRTFVFEEGTIGNFNFLAVPFNAANVAGALVTINYLMSVESALDLSRALRATFPLRLDRLTAAERAAVEALPRGAATLPLEELNAHVVAEADASYLERLEKDWLERVLRQ